MKRFYPILEKCSLFEGITDLDGTLSKLKARLKYFDKNEVIRQPETIVTELGIVVEGVAFISKVDYEGNRMILGELKEGATFGESLAYTNATNSPVSVYAAKDTLVVFVSAKNIVELDPDFSEQGKLIKNLVRRFAEKTMLLQIKTDILSQKSIRDRLLLYLEFEEKTAGSNAFEISYSREELADFLSQNVSAVSRELGKLRDEGLITFKKNRFVLNK